MVIAIIVLVFIVYPGLLVAAPCGLEKKRRKFMQASAPGLPFVGSAQRFVIDMPDTGFLQRQMEVATTGRHPSFGGADADEEHLHLFGESRGITQQSIEPAGDFRKTEWRAEASNIGEFVKVRLCDFLGLRATE